MKRGREVWVTGVGMITSLGIGLEATWQRLMAGETGMEATTSDEARIIDCPSRSVVKGFRGRDFIKNRKQLKLMTRQVQLGMAAASLGIADAGLDVAQVTPEHFGVFVGAGQAFADSSELEYAFEKSRTADGDFDIKKFGGEGLNLIHPLWLLRGLSNNVLGFVSLEYNAQGINNNYCNSGISSAQAILSGARAISEGMADVVIAGGYDAIVNAEGMLGYGRLGLIAKSGTDPATSHRPFDRRRSGLVPAEGACFLILEARSHAEARDRTGLARVSGGGVASDGFHISNPDPDGGKLERAVRAALAEAELDATELDAIYAHGASSVRFDQIEAQVYRRVLGSAAMDVPVCADKCAIGHTVAASAAISSGLVCKSLEVGKAPAISTLKDIDDDCAGLRYVTGGPLSITPNHILTSSAGLGGQAASLIFSAIVD